MNGGIVGYVDLDMPEEEWIRSTTQAERLANRVQGEGQTVISAEVRNIFKPGKYEAITRFWPFFARSLAARKGWATRRAK